MARTFTDGGAAATGLATAASAGRCFDAIASGVGAWAGWVFRTGAPAAERGLVGFGDFLTDVGWWVNLGTTGLLAAMMPFATTNRVRTSSTATALNAWTHFVVNSAGKGTSNTEFTFYINGKFEAGTSTTNPTGAAPIAGSFAAKIGPGPGTQGAANSLAPPAHIGPVAFWNRQLTDAEALALAAGAHPFRFWPGLLEMWDMDEPLLEEGTVTRLPMLHSTTIPGTTFVNPPIEPLSLLLPPFRLNTRARHRDRRYVETVAAGGAVLNDYNFRRVMRGVGMGISRGAA